MKKQIRFKFKGTLHTVDVERDGNELTLESSGETYQVTLLPEEGAVKKPSAAKALKKSKPAPVAPVVKSSPAPAPSQPAASASTNTIDYTTGALTITFTTAPVTGIVLQEQYSYDSEVSAQRTDLGEVESQDPQ